MHIVIAVWYPVSKLLLPWPDGDTAGSLACASLPQPASPWFTPTARFTKWNINKPPQMAWFRITMWQLVCNSSHAKGLQGSHIVVMPLPCHQFLMGSLFHTVALWEHIDPKSWWGAAANHLFIIWGVDQLMITKSYSYLTLHSFPPQPSKLTQPCPHFTIFFFQVPSFLEPKLGPPTPHAIIFATVRPHTFHPDTYPNLGWWSGDERWKWWSRSSPRSHPASPRWPGKTSSKHQRTKMKFYISTWKLIIVKLGIFKRSNFRLQIRFQVVTRQRYYNQGQSRWSGFSRGGWVQGYGGHGIV